MQFEFTNWQPLFKQYLPKHRVLTAPEEFREYLLADGIVLHEDQPSSDSDWETPVIPAKQPEDDEVLGRAPPVDFHHEIEAVIRELNGEVVPKLNWSAPVDSKWILPSNTMRCTTANDIYMLLKSSDYINHDLQMEPQQITLVLREWFDLHPSTEFRCFVKNKELVGISQRDMNYYDFLEAQKPIIREACGNMAQIIADKFPLSDFVFDVHIPRPGKRAWLIDINPWDLKTDSILFNWDEMPENLDIRLVEKADRTRTFSSKPHSTSQVPYDLVDMERGNFEEVLKQMKKQREQGK